MSVTVRLPSKRTARANGHRPHEDPTSSPGSPMTCSRPRLHAPLLHLASAALVATALAGPARAQLVGENVNMVSGTAWPGGDPFLQRQNEPSIAVSSANADHLVAGANDYRTVDLPDPNTTGSTGDAWLGLFKSVDGGLTWRSVLLPGYPQDGSPEGLASPLRGFRSAADPVVRAGTDGMLYYSGIAFDRATGLGVVFVARLADLNDKENGDATLGRDPIAYLGATLIDRGTDGQFTDKPWPATDVPRAGAGTCTLPTSPPRSFPAGTVYLAYSTFTGSKENASKILLSRSLDCGATWSRPVKISESNSLNQGTAVAVDPLTGTVWVAWRRYASSSETDAIVVSRSTDFGQTFTRAEVVADIVPFDQPLTETAFRAQTLPTIAISVDAAGTRSFVHLAWQERRGPSGDSRIVLSTSADGASWSAPTPIDDAPVHDDLGDAFTRGHQVMPQLTFSQGRLLALYYDTRLDHTRAYHAPNLPFLPDPVTGAFYAEWRAPLGELLTSPGAVFGPFIDDAGLTQVRHTIDVRVATAGPGPAPAFSSTRVSRMPFGTRGDEVVGQQAASFAGPPLEVVDGAGTVKLLQQLQVNPPNLPMFRKGTAPFMGDYIDIAGPAFARTAAGWAFDTVPSAAPVHHAIWTSNQDVRPPADGDWTRYTPVGLGGPSTFDPAVARPACVPGYEGSRNQNVYTARITSGLAVSSPQNVKPLAPGLTRAFVVAVANSTDRTIAVRLSAAPPAGVTASFRNDGVQLGALDVEVGPRSAVFRSLFVALAGSVDPLPTIPVRVQQVDPAGGCLGALPPTCPLVPGGLAGSVTFNPPGVFPGLVQPDGSPDDVTELEVYAPTVALANVTSANVTSANVTSANVTSANVTSANVTSANVTSTHVANPDLANVTSANVTSAPIASANVTSANVTSSAVSDANYTVTNTGNTTHSYHVKLVGTPGGGPLQLIVSKPYLTPLAISCLLLEQPRNAVVVNVDDVSSAILPPTSSLLDANIPDPRTTNATLSLAPGETAQITLRGALGTVELAGLIAQLTPVVVPHAGGAYAASLLVTSDGALLPAPRVGVPYAASLQALGGVPPYAWALASGALPAGLVLAPDGAITGTPTEAGTATFTVEVTDAAAQAGTATRVLTLTVARGPTTTTLSASPSAAVSGQPVTFTAHVAPQDPGAPSPEGTVTFTDGGAVLGSAQLSGGAASLTTAALGAGTHAVVAAYGGDARYLGSASAEQPVAVGLAATSLSLVSSPNPSIAGAPVTFTATVTVTAPGAGTATGSVTFLDGATALGTAPLAGGVATFTTADLATGARTISATYPGDARLGPSAATLTQTVNAPVFYGFTGFLTPLATAGILAAPSYSGTQRLGSAVPVKWQLTDATGAFIDRLSTTRRLTAVRNPGCSGPPPAGAAVVVLYSPTSGATGGSTFRYASDQFIFNWDTTSAAKGCYTLVLELDDGSAPRATTVKLQ